MNDIITVYDFENFLDLYRINNNSIILVTSGFKSQIASFKTNIGQQINDLIKKNAHVDDSNDENNMCPAWVNNQIKLGYAGEQIAFKYLSDHFNNVKDVTNDSFKGYDIAVISDAGIDAFEVKTTSCAECKLFISLNELKVAERMNDNYNIFYININREEAEITGFIINDPIRALNIDMEVLTIKIDMDNVIIAPANFLIRFQQQFTENLEYINLIKYKDI